MWCLCGDLQRRNTTLAFILTTMAALGFKVALEKGERANAVTWIGVRLAILEQQFLAVTLPEKFMEDLINLVSSWNEGMAPVKELRKAAGKLSWLAGILPRARWLVRVFYGALHGHEKDVMSGKEDRVKKGESRRCQEERPPLCHEENRLSKEVVAGVPQGGKGQTGEEVQAAPKRQANCHHHHGRIPRRTGRPNTGCSTRRCVWHWSQTLQWPWRWQRRSQGSPQLWTRSELNWASCWKRLASRRWSAGTSLGRPTSMPTTSADLQNGWNTLSRKS